VLEGASGVDGGARRACGNFMRVLRRRCAFFRTVDVGARLQRATGWKDATLATSAAQIRVRRDADIVVGCAGEVTPRRAAHDQITIDRSRGQDAAHWCRAQTLSQLHRRVTATIAAGRRP
jgi:hypothetical protein